VTVWRARPGGRQVQGHTIGSKVDTPAEGVGVTGQRSNQRVWLNLVATQRELDLERPGPVDQPWSDVPSRNLSVVRRFHCVHVRIVLGPV
jgi:hypothetical protein